MPTRGLVQPIQVELPDLFVLNGHEWDGIPLVLLRLFGLLGEEDSCEISRREDRYVSTVWWVCLQRLNRQSGIVRQRELNPIWWTGDYAERDDLEKVQLGEEVVDLL
jgi:hypothetical protein